MDELFMGVDIGTSGVRAALFNKEGYQVALYHKEYPLICHLQAMGELKPETVFSAFMEVIRKCIDKVKTKTVIKSIGLSTQLFSILAVDKEGNCLTNAFTWVDARCMDCASNILKNFDIKDLYRRTGCRVDHPMYPLSKIIWIRETQPILYEKVYKFVSIKSFILYRLFGGEYIIDITDASTTAYFNIHTFDWDEKILNDVLDINKEYFPIPKDITYTLTGIKDEYAKVMTVDKNTPVVIGSGDGMLANLGCGVFDDTSMSCTIGTSGAIRIAIDKPILDEQCRTWCYCFTRDTWVAGGAVNNGGIVLKWLRDEYSKQFEAELKETGDSNTYKLFDRYAKEIKPGSEGLIFLPYLTGERSPGWHADAKASVHGFQLVHGRKHIIRAAMEGVFYNMYNIYEAVTKMGDNVQAVIANGGYDNSDIWLQIQADIFGKEITVAGAGEAAAFGAAYAGMVAIGALNGFTDVLPSMKTSKIVKPNDNNIEIYREAYRQFTMLYDKIVV